MTVIEGLGWTYVAATWLWLALRVFWFDAHWLPALLNDGALYLFTPLPLFLTYAIWQQKYALLLALGAPSAAFLILFGARFLPRAPLRLEPTRARYLVMSFNMHYANWNLDAFAQTTRQFAPVLVGLQEVSAPNRAFIETALADMYPYRVYQPIRERHAVALLSRYPLSRVEFLSPDLERGLRATAQLPDIQVTIIVAHLAPPNMLNYPLNQFTTLARSRLARRRAEAVLLRQLGAREADPAILLCDGNMSATSRTYQIIATSWRDSFVERGWGLGHTLKVFSPIPLQRYDYIWHNDRWRVSKFRIARDSGSDHLPVLATLHES